MIIGAVTPLHPRVSGVDGDPIVDPSLPRPPYIKATDDLFLSHCELKITSYVSTILCIVYPQSPNLVNQILQQRY